MQNLLKAEKLLFFLAILFLPTQLGRHFWPKFSFVYSLPVDYLSPTLYFWDLIAVSMVIIFILRGGRVNRLALNLFFIFLLTQILSLVTNISSFGVGLVRLEQYFIAGLFGVYIASAKKELIKANLFWGLSVGMMFEGILAALQFLKGGTLGFWILGERTFSISTPAIAKFDYHGYEFLRPYATFPHPNVLAGFMILNLVILLTLKNFWPHYFKHLKPILISASLLSVLSILLTVSRVSIIALLTFAVTFATKNRDRLLILLAVLILLPVLYTRFSSLINFDNLTYIRREELTLIAIKLWKTSPIFGVGLNNFIPTASDLILSGPSRFLQPVHDVFLLSLSETGIVGLAGLMTLFGYPIYRFLKSTPKTANKYPFLMIWTIVIFLALFDHYFLTLPQGYRLLFLIWGLSLTMIE